MHSARTYTLQFAMFLILIGCFACSEALDEHTTAQESVVVVDANDDDGKSDSLEELSARIEGMTVWFRPVVEALPGSGETMRWVVRGRTSHNLTAVSAATAQAALSGARSVSARKFEVELSHVELGQMLATDGRLYLRLSTASGRTAYAMFKPRVQVATQRGSSAIFVWKNLTPLSLADGVGFRGRLTANSALAQAHASRAGIDVFADGPRHFHVDFTAYALLAAAFDASTPLVFAATNERGVEVRREAVLATRAAEIGVSWSAPFASWPEAALADGLHTRFASDLRAALEGHYARYGSDIVASGGNSLADARASVDVGQIEELADPDDDPYGHDFSSVQVLVHPDVSFPGSGAVWFGAYERDGGALIGVYSFN
ncbi:MAG: hypothetical protein H0U74_12340 [Bradymonadaceae bacterium]|nr:hypothetical protein [Lujinxingiaceae bacterium]